MKHEMTLEQAMSYCFKDEPHKGEKRKWFSNHEAANIYSDSLKPIHNEGLGLIYGPFANSKTVNTFPYKWWEVSYK